jgi:hypothetical protein
LYDGLYIGGRGITVPLRDVGTEELRFAYHLIGRHRTQHGKARNAITRRSKHATPLVGRKQPRAAGANAAEIGRTKMFSERHIFGACQSAKLDVWA